MSLAPAPATRVAALALLALAAAACGPRVAEAPRRSGPPNIVLIVVDTLRADHLPFYGYRRDTTPQIATRLAARGTVVERATAAAPWTMPSMAALLTGLDPRRLAQEGRRIDQMPADATTLATRLAAAGYETAGFSANPLLATYNGYARGFETFWRAPGGMEAIHQHAPVLQEQIVSWLERRPAAATRPLFLWAHYIDPHDPYENADMVRGRSPFDPLYQGALRGGDVQALYRGARQVDDLAETRRALAAFYDGELLYVDRFAAGIVDLALRKLGPDTLFVFTADHGEELGERGGWKHGQTLYEEQLHVPLVFRWDGRIAAGRRLAGDATLLDLSPTLLAAAGAPAAGLDGRDLLPSLLGAGVPLPRRGIATRHWNFGALRVEARSGAAKVALYNSRESFTSDDPLRAHLEAIDHARLPRLARFDLAADPGEQHPLDGAWSPFQKALADSALAYVDGSLAGLRVVARDLPAGTTLEGRLRLAAPAGEALPFFLAAPDEVTAAGDEIRFRLTADAIAKGFLLPAPSDVVTIEARLAGGTASPALAIRFGKGDRFARGPIRLAALARDDWERGDGTPALWLWTRVPMGAANAGAAAADDTERELRALGYLN